MHPPISPLDHQPQILPNYFGCQTVFTEVQAKVTSAVVGTLAAIGLAFLLSATTAILPFTCAVLGIMSGIILGVALCYLIKPDTARYINELKKDPLIYITGDCYN
ncbi:MAG: hypothetical protein H0T62_09370 [Parachlamydiaceae bacterium]|nr:hypothetical protein [Parachlamydiaceae bacterium]